MYNTILTHFGCFTNYPQSCSTSVRGVKVTNIGDLGVRNACIKSIYIKGICAKSTFARSPSIIKYLRIYLQSFGILEVELFVID